MTTLRDNTGWIGLRGLALTTYAEGDVLYAHLGVGSGAVVALPGDTLEVIQAVEPGGSSITVRCRRRKTALPIVIPLAEADRLTLVGVNGVVDESALEYARRNQ